MGKTVFVGLVYFVVSQIPGGLRVAVFKPSVLMKKLEKIVWMPSTTSVVAGISRRKLSSMDGRIP